MADAEALPRAATLRRPLGLGALGVVAAAVVAIRVFSRDGDAVGEALATWGTLFIALNIQALPFLVLGVTVSGVVAAWLPPEALARALPRNPAAAVVTASGAGLLLPGCECGSVPISGRLVARGVVPAAALAFMLAAPAINPVVLVSTAVAFPGQPEFVVARFVASLATSIVVGWLYLRRGATDQLRARARARVQERGTPFETFVASATHDLLHAGGYLVLGAALAATIQVVVPRSVMDAIAGMGAGWVAVFAMAGLAIALSICSEADAFVAASLTQFSLTSRLVFLVVGPAVDLKLVALQAGFFGKDFAARFAPVTVLVAIAAAVITARFVL